MNKIKARRCPAGHPSDMPYQRPLRVSGTVEIPAKWQTGRYSQSESSGTEGLGSGPVWERVARQGQMETHGRSSVQGGVSIRRRRGINNKRTIATS